MEQEVVFSCVKGDSVTVADDLVKQLKKESAEYNAVLFFASSDYDFYSLSKELKSRFPQSEVIGTSTSGEISQNGFTKGSVVLTAFSCQQTKVSGVLIEEVNKFPIIQRKKIVNAMQKIGIRAGDKSSHMHAFALTFVNGLRNAEEALLSLLYAVIKNNDFMVAGGTAGDDLKFKETYVSYNGETVTDGAVVLFFSTRLKFDIRKENIYKPSGRQVKITSSDTKQRRIITINNNPARKEYARVINYDETKLSEAILDHPFGRVYGENIFISSLAGFNDDNSINMYCRVLSDTKVDILEPDDYRQKAEETCNSIKMAVKKPQFVLFINCILRTIYFDQKKAFEPLISLYKNYFTSFCGFSSYGEQFGQVNSNQTLVSIVIGE